MSFPRRYWSMTWNHDPGGASDIPVLAQLVGKIPNLSKFAVLPIIAFFQPIIFHSRRVSDTERPKVKDRSSHRIWKSNVTRSTWVTRFKWFNRHFYHCFLMLRLLRFTSQIHTLALTECVRVVDLLRRQSVEKLRFRRHRSTLVASHARKIFQRTEVDLLWPDRVCFPELVPSSCVLERTTRSWRSFWWECNLIVLPNCRQILFFCGGLAYREQWGKLQIHIE